MHTQNKYKLRKYIILNMYYQILIVYELNELYDVNLFVDTRVLVLFRQDTPYQYNRHSKTMASNHNQTTTALQYTQHQQHTTNQPQNNIANSDYLVHQNSTANITVNNPLSIPTEIQPNNSHQLQTNALQGYSVQSNNQPPLYVHSNSIPQSQLNTAQVMKMIRLGPYSHTIGEVDYTYSLLPKKKARFFGENLRLLVLKGVQSIFYASSLSASTLLPFSSHTSFPKPKTSFPLSQIAKAQAKDSSLLLYFKDKDRSVWQFVCGSVQSAQEWREIVFKRVGDFMEFRESAFESFGEFRKWREGRQREIMANKQEFSNQLMGQKVQTNQYNNTIQGKSGELNQAESPIKINLGNQTFASQSTLTLQQVSPSVQQNYKAQPISPSKPRSVTFQGAKVISLQQTSPSIQDNTKVQLPSPSKPRTVTFQGSKVIKVQELTQNSPNIATQSKKQLVQCDIKATIGKMRRNWIQQLLGGQDEAQLIIQFRNYVQKIVQNIVKQLHLPSPSKTFPAKEVTKDHALFLLEDVSITLFFWRQEHIGQQNSKYKSAVDQFNNMDYLLSCTKNRGVLRVPFMVRFEYKGFVGIAKSRLQEGAYRNRQVYDMLDKRQFQQSSRVSANVLLNQQKCKIVLYDRKTSLSKVSNSQRVYFVDKLVDFLPKGADGLQIRPQLIHSHQFQDTLFLDKSISQHPEMIASIQQEKIKELVSLLQSEQDYFTNSQELVQSMHLSGLSASHLGALLKVCKYQWLQKTLRAQIAARCLKNFFRFDLQSCVMQRGYEVDQIHRAISFLNVVLGNNDSTFTMWRKVNHNSQNHFGVKIWQQELKQLNTAYLLQALQSNLKIRLTSSIHTRPLFASMQTFNPQDFSNFQCQGHIFSLQFTDSFQQIEDCLQQTTNDSFYQLCELLTKQTSTHTPFLQLIDGLPTHQHISQYLLNFTSPEDSPDLYNKISQGNMPSRLIFEGKIAQIKWSLKTGRKDQVSHKLNFVKEQGQKWLGKVHPIFTQVYRLLADYFSQLEGEYQRALGYAKESLTMQRSLFGGDNQHLWKDYFMIGRIHYVNGRPEALQHLIKARKLVNTQKLTQSDSYAELNLMRAKCYISTKSYKEAYNSAKELYNTVKNKRDQLSLGLIIDSVAMIKQLLEMNQQHQSYQKFIQNDFGTVAHVLYEYPALLKSMVKMIALPYLKNVILKKSKNRTKLMMIIEDVAKITQSQKASLSYLQSRMRQGAFPKTYLQCLGQMDKIVQDIRDNQMMDRWNTFNRMSNQTLLEKIGSSQINRGFQFLAYMTAIFNLLGRDAVGELRVMEKF